MPSQTAGSARAPVFGHAPTASESGHTEGKKEQRRWERGREGGRERKRGEEKAATSSSVYKTRKGSSQRGENKDPNKQEKNPTKQKTVTTGFYMVLVVAVHKKMESVMGKHPSALESCFRVFLHQDDTEGTF